MDVNLWIVTGGIGSGKTAFCRELVDIARQSCWDVAGLLSPAVFHEGSKEAIWAENLRSGEKRLLASARSQTEMDFVFGEWFFDRSTLEWGNQVLQASIPCDLLVIDELGPLEFYLSMGWVSALDITSRAQFYLAVIVIRPELLVLAQSMLHPTQMIHLRGMNDVAEQVRQYSPFFKKHTGNV